MFAFSKNRTIDQCQRKLWIIIFRKTPPDPQENAADLTFPCQPILQAGLAPHP